MSSVAQKMAGKAFDRRKRTIQKSIDRLRETIREREAEMKHCDEAKAALNLDPEDASDADKAPA